MITPDKNCFEKNIALLKKYHPKAFEIVSKGQKHQSTETELVFAENQKPNLKVKTPGNEWLLIHDPVNPGVESETFLSMVPEDSTGVVLIYGMGLGYSVIELLRKRKKLRCMIVFELNIEFFVHAVQYIDFSDFFEDKRLNFCIGEPEDLPSVMAPSNRALMLENIHILKLQTCLKINPGYEILSSKVFDHINAYNTEGATKTVHGSTFFANRIKHLTSMHHDKKLEDLAGKFEGFPAIIIAAGPSLDKNIDQISKAVGKAVIISVDTALPKLLDHGIKPDFITAIDYNELTYEKIFRSAADPVSKQVNLICTSWVADTVTKQFPAKDIFWAFSNNALENWINISLGGKMAIGGAGTVAHMNFIAASIMGCDPIIFVGQDLSFSNSRGHSSNVVLNSDEMTKKLLDSGRDIMWVKGLVEEKVPTNRQMYGYKHVFEKMIKASKGHVINSTEGGLLIEGTENIPLAQAIDSFCRTNIIFGIGEISYEQKSPLESIESTIKKVNKLEKIIKKADKLAPPVKAGVTKLIKSSKKILSFSALPEKLKKIISDLDASHKKADENSLWPIFDEMTMEGLRQDERKKQEIERLEGIPDKYLEWLSKSVDRIDRVNKIRMNNLERFKKYLTEILSFYHDEKRQLEKIQKDASDLNAILELASLYYQSDNYVLLEKMIDRYASEIKDSAQLHYYYGIIALCRGDYGTAESRFQSSINCDASFFYRINKKRNEIADYYYKLATAESTLKDFGRAIVELLLLKGLKCNPDHEVIKKEFRKFAEDDLAKIKIESGSGKQLLKKWIDLFDRDGEVLGCLGKDVIFSFYFFYGKILKDEEKYQKALKNFHKLLVILPDNPEVHINMADIYFAIKDFDSGLQSLRTAVNLDKKYAVYWYNMGKYLQSQNDYNGAVLAYEQYYIALPEKIDVLKDIGDCHAKIGNLDAAREAYQQLKNLSSRK